MEQPVYQKLPNSTTRTIKEFSVLQSPSDMETYRNMQM